MADMQNKAEIAPDIIQVQIGANNAWFHTKVKVAGNYVVEPITVGSIGPTPIAHMFMGMLAKLQFTFIQWSEEILEAIWALSDGKNLAPGTLLPETSIKLHNLAHGADHSKDLVFPIANFINPSLDHDGKSVAEWQAEAVVCINTADLTVVQMGVAE